MTDPFANPTPRVSTFPSVASFRGRLVLIRPLKIERDIPKQASAPNGPKGDRVTANVTVVDGSGPVELFPQGNPSGQFIDGPEFRGVYIGQDQLAAGLQDVTGNLLGLVLTRIDTLKPGTRPGQGNPWVFNEASEADKDMARAFLAAQMVGGASAPSAAPAPAPAPMAKTYAEAPAQTPHPVGGPFAGPPASMAPAQVAPSAPLTQGPPF